MSEARTEQTLLISEQTSGFPKPESVVDLEEVGIAYLRKAKADTALARWEAACPKMMAETNWQDARLAAYAQRHAQILAWTYHERGLLATGLSGTGKSRSMWALMKRMAEEGREIRYFTASSWFAMLQTQIVFGHDNAQGWVSTLAKAPVVFIDDLGQEAIQTNKQEWCSGWLFQFLDLRLGHGLPLFVTTNLTAKQMADDAGAVRGNPLVRRILDLCDVVKF